MSDLAQPLHFDAPLLTASSQTWRRGVQRAISTLLAMHRARTTRLVLRRMDDRLLHDIGVVPTHTLGYTTEAGQRAPRF